MGSNGKILVTGAGGFIGSHLAEELVRQNYKVKAFVLYNSFNSWGWLDNADKAVTDNMEIICGDVRDPFCVNDAVKGCDAVMHLAALIAIPYSYMAPASYVDTNITGTLNILSAAKKSGVEKVIHTSTSEVYGSAMFVPITEDHPLQGQSPYSATKIGADQLALSYYRSFNTPVTIIRPFNTYGPRQSARAVIPTIITQVLSGKKNIKLGHLTPTRDFSYVEDTVNGFIAAARSETCNGEVINLGTGFEISIKDIVEMILRLMGSDMKIETERQRTRPEKSEVNRLCSDNTKAKRLLDWEPAFSNRKGLEKGLEKTIEWFSKKKNISGYKTGIYNI
ncbi:MAG: SDR family NAD(P)-dependent oxidoreductase [Deltaproteobacteria bacterium]|nr:SDR family NAD(P)-dependent oxidoreductase [Deltaproteobacteria bacterium]